MGNDAAFMQPCQFGNERLAQCSNGKSIINSGRHITNTKLNSLKKWMRANVPPDLLAVIYASRLHKALHIAVEVVPRGKWLGYTIAGQRSPDHRAIRFEARETPSPERRVSRDGKQV